VLEENERAGNPFRKGGVALPMAFNTARHRESMEG
jgi:hypothetical protein